MKNALNIARYLCVTFATLAVEEIFFANSKFNVIDVRRQIGQLATLCIFLAIATCVASALTSYRLNQGSKQ